MLNRLIKKVELKAAEIFTWTVYTAGLHPLWVERSAELSTIKSTMYLCHFLLKQEEYILVVATRLQSML